MRAAPAAADALFGEKTACVYICQALPTTYMKVGVAQDVEKRRRALQTANYHDLVMIWAIRLPLSRVFKTETLIHHELNRERQRGEWFLSSVERVHKVAKKISCAMGGLEEIVLDEVPAG